MGDKLTREAVLAAVKEATDEERVEVFLSIWEDAGPAQRARLMEIIRLRLDGATGSDGDDEMGYGMG